MFLLFPIGVAEKPRRQPLTTITLIFVTLVVYAVMVWGEMPFQQVVDRWGFIPNEATPATFLASQFIHPRVWKLLLNVWILSMVGPLLESRLGHFPFLLLYLAGGIAAWATAGALDQGTNRMIVHAGAAGSLAAVMGAFVILYPFADFKIWYCFALFYYYGIKIGTFRVMALLVIGLWFLGQIGSLWLAPRGAAEGIDLVAQMGGFFFGAVAAAVGFGKEGLNRETTYED